MKTAFVLLAAVVVFASAQRGNSNSKERACKNVLKPERDDLKTDMDSCIAEQDGLQAIIDGLKPEEGDRPEGGRREGSRPGGRRPSEGRRGHRGGNPICLLEEGGYTDEAAALKTCLARISGHVSSDGTFDVSGFQAEITSKVSGTGQQANVELGIANCPTDALTDFDVKEYMRCVMAYCATGEAPTTEA